MSQLCWLTLGETKWIPVGENLSVLWQVRRIGAASKAKPLYVPATYVTEVPITPMASPQRLVMSASLNSNLRTLPRVSLSPSPSATTYNEHHQGKVWDENNARKQWLFHSVHHSLIGVKWFYLPPSVNKPIYRSMENLNSNSAFHRLDNHTSTGGGRFPTLPLSGFTFTPNSPTSLSGHLMVPGSPAAFAAQTVPRNPRVVPMITRSQSSSNLPENVLENPYDEVGRSFSSHANHRMPKKSCSQWDMVGASGKNNHLQVGLLPVLTFSGVWDDLCWIDVFWKAVGGLHL